MMSLHGIIQVGMVCMICPLVTSSIAAGSEPGIGRTLRSYGAIGDGVTDDRGAIEAALNGAKGARVDGEGRSYAVCGNILVENDVDFHHATLVQTMAPPETRRYLAAAAQHAQLVVDPPDALRRMVHGIPLLNPEGIASSAADAQLNANDLAALRPGLVVRTLNIEGRDTRPVAVNLSQIRIVRGRDASSGASNDSAALRIANGGPVRLEAIEITGEGKGYAVCVLRCTDVRIDKLHVHDLIWAPYRGDDVFAKLTVESLRDDFAWNDFPLYELRSDAGRFVRIRAREQIVGLYVGRSRDIVISDAKIERLQTRAGEQLLPLQTDGITLNRVDDIVLRNCAIADVWEGIDFTGPDGNRFRYENCTVSRALGTAFKFVYSKRNGTLVDCTAEGAGQNGFSTGRYAEDLELVNCRALETGATGVYTKEDGSRVATICGIDIAGAVGLATPRRITLRGCSAVNKSHPGAMDYGIRCEAPPAGREIILIDCEATGARIQDVAGMQE
jgi:hypothetical protein